MSALPAKLHRWPDVGFQVSSLQPVAVPGAGGKAGLARGCWSEIFWGAGRELVGPRETSGVFAYV